MARNIGGTCKSDLSSKNITVFKGEIWHLQGDPFTTANAFTGIPDGALAVAEDGRIEQVGPAASVCASYPESEVVDFGGDLILPGFVDAHLHLPQLDMIGAPGGDLLHWLSHYTFPLEAGFVDEHVCTDTARRLCVELLANGTTTAAIFGSVHKPSAAAMFKAALASGLRAIVGKVSMDRNAPAGVLQSPEADWDDSVELIETWHGNAGRLFYALTPRFAPTSTPALLASLGRLHERFPDLLIQTHVAETPREIAWVQALFGDAQDYVDVYDSFGLLTSRTVLAHCIHLSDRERERVRAVNAGIVHCPSSNLFLGSGLCPVKNFGTAQFKVGLGSDIAGGTSISLLRNMLQAYEVSALRAQPLSPSECFFLGTLGGAQILGLEHSIGNFTPGKFGDFQVLSPRRNRLLKRRLQTEKSPEARLFALLTHGDDRLVREVYIGGKRVFAADWHGRMEGAENNTSSQTTT